MYSFNCFYLRWVLVLIYSNYILSDWLMKCVKLKKCIVVLLCLLWIYKFRRVFVDCWLNCFWVGNFFYGSYFRNDKYGNCEVC